MEKNILKKTQKFTIAQWTFSSSDKVVEIPELQYMWHLLIWIQLHIPNKINPE